VDECRFSSPGIVLILALLLTASVGVPVDETVDSNAGAEPLALRLMELLQAGNTSAASSLFHFPASYNYEERERDRKAVQEALKALLDVFGKPVEFSIQTSAEQYYELGIFGGTMSYWESHPNAGIDAQRVYSVRFSDAGDGVVNVALFHNAGSWEVRSVGFGMTKSNDRALEIMERARNRLLALLQS
jgi:hypothetical protein